MPSASLEPQGATKAATPAPASARPMAATCETNQLEGCSPDHSIGSDGMHKWTKEALYKTTSFRSLRGDSSGNHVGGLLRFEVKLAEAKPRGLRGAAEVNAAGREEV